MVSKDLFGELVDIVARYMEPSEAEEMLESLCSRIMVFPEELLSTDLPTLLLGFCSNDDILDMFEPQKFADLMDSLIAFATPKYMEGLCSPWDLMGDQEGDQRTQSKVWDAYNTQKDQAGLLMQIIRNLVDEIVKERSLEDQLRGSEHKLHRMLEISPETTLIHVKGRIVYSNPAGIKLFGAKSGEELIGRSVMDLIQTSYQETHHDLESHKHDQGGDSISDRIIRFDGRYVDVEVTASPTNFEGKSAVQLVIKDITDKVRAQRALKESEIRYRLLAENIADVIWTMDLNLNFTYVSPSVMRLRGFTVEEALNQRLDEVLTPKSLEKATTFFKEELARDRSGAEYDGPVRSLELDQYRKDGSVVKTEVRITGLHDHEGEAIGILGLTRDITERKKAEEKLAASEAKFRRLFDKMVEGVYRTTPKGKLLTANPALVKMLGYDSFDELKKVNVGKHLYIEPKDRNKFIDQLERTGELRNLELHLKRRDGTELVVLENSHIVTDKKGNVKYYEGTLTDITDLRQVDKQLKTSEERFKRLFDNMVEGVFQTTPNGRVLTANKAFLDILGYGSLDELLKIDIAEDLYANPNERKTFIRKLGKDGVLKDYVIDMKRADGSLITVKENVLAVRDKKGRVKYYEGTMEDITESNAVQRALEESEKRMRQLVESLGDGVCIADSDENFLFVNPAAETMFGTAHGKLLGRNLKDFVSPQTYKQIKEQTKKRRKGESGVYDIEIVRPDGEVRQVIVNATPRYDEKGNFTSSFGIFTDITDRKRMEKELDESQERYKELVEKAEIAIVIDDENGDYIYYNQMFLDMYGYNDKDMRKTRVSDLVHPDDRKRVETIHKNRLKNKEAPERYRFKGIKKSGEAFWVEVDAVERKTDGRIAGTRAYLRDITEQVEMEERYRDLVEMAGIAIIQDDDKNNIVYYNQKFLDLYGYTDKEMKKLTRKDLVHPDDYEMVVGHHNARMKGKNIPLRYRFRGRRKTGEVIHIEVDVSPIIADKKVVGSRAYLKDITEIWEMEQAVKRSEAMFKDLVEKAGIAILMDTKKGEFQYFNEKFLELFGYTDKEIRNLTIRDLVHPDDVKKVMQRHKERLSGKNPPSRYRFRGVMKNGQTVYLEVEAVEIIKDGEIVGTRSYLWDITKRLKVEETIRKHKAMIESMRGVEKELKKMESKIEKKAGAAKGKKRSGKR